MKPEEVKRFLELQTLFDKMKTIRRKSMVTGREEMENDAEHSWHAVMWFLMMSHCFPELNSHDLHKIVIMLLIHDLPELFCIDVSSYSKSMNDKLQEAAAAFKLFMNLLPETIGNDCYLHWSEFNSGNSIEVRIARAIDALQPMLQNINTGGKMWRELGVTLADIDRVKRPVICINETLTTIYEELYKKARQILDPGNGEIPYILEGDDH